MASAVTVELSRNGKYAILTDGAGGVYPCTDAEEAWEILMELAEREDLPAVVSQPYDDDRRVVHAEAISDEEYEQERQERQTIYVDDDGEEVDENGYPIPDLGDPVSNYAAEVAVNSGVSLFKTLQSLSYRGKAPKKKASDRDDADANLPVRRRNRIVRRK